MEAGREGAGGQEMYTSRFFVWKTEAAKKHLLINELAAAAGVEMEPRDVGRLTPGGEVLAAGRLRFAL